MRALVNLIVATLLLLSVQAPTNQGSSFTTTMSGIVAPYLPQSTPYVRPLVAQLISDNQLHIRNVAHIYNQPALSGMTDAEFASVLVMILYTEHHGWLEDVVPSIRPLTPYFQQLQVLSNQLLDTNFSVWPANLRPSVVDEIRNEATPFDSFVVLKVMTSRDTNNYLAYNPQSAIELLAANMARGIYRTHAAGIPVTPASILAWHNAGIIDPEVIATNRSIQHYISRALVYQTIAHLSISEVVACLRTQPF